VILARKILFKCALIYKTREREIERVGVWRGREGGRGEKDRNEVN
jgi:hypothetical protein